MSIIFSDKAIRSNPMVRRPRSQEVKTLLESGPLTIIQVKTVKGDTAYKFKARPTKYAYEDDLRRMVCSLFRKVYPEDKETVRARQARYCQRSHDKVVRNRRKYRLAHRETLMQKQRAYRARQKQA